MNSKELARLIARRDGISENEAYEVLDECQEEINEAIANNGSYDDIADILADVLGLEPDYMDYFLM